MQRNIAASKLLALIKAKDKAKPFQYKSWVGTKFQIMKLCAPTEKGNIGEDFLAELLKYYNYTGVEVTPGRRGDYDVSLRQRDKVLLFEVKVATQDMSGKFQFAGIRLDTQYTHLFCLGIAPTEIGFLAFPKEELKNGRYKVTSMIKQGTETFKLQRAAEEMLSFEVFQDTIKELISHSETGFSAT